MKEREQNWKNKKNYKKEHKEDIKKKFERKEKGREKHLSDKKTKQTK